MDKQTLTALRITNETHVDLALASPVVEAHVDEVIEAFYSFVLATPGMGEVFPKPHDAGSCEGGTAAPLGRVPVCRPLE